jgi:hypothetical protein
MNERIEKLMVNASSGACYDGNEPVLSGTEIEKFAELIVRECMNCSTWVGEVNKNPVEPIHTAHAINKCIKKHFGVE